MALPILHDRKEAPDERILDPPEDRWVCLHTRRPRKPASSHAPLPTACLHTRRPPKLTSCFRSNADASPPSAGCRHPWTKEDDTLLRRQVEKFARLEPKPWGQIAMGCELESKGKFGHNNGSCKKRFEELPKLTTDGERRARTPRWNAVRRFHHCNGALTPGPTLYHRQGCLRIQARRCV